MSETDYAPYVPPAPMFDDSPKAGPKLPKPPVHEKKPRKKRPPAAGKPAKPRKVAAKKKPKARKPASVAQAVKAVKRHYAGVMQPAEPKYTLSEALAIGGSLQPEDLKLFGQIESDLRALPKDARARILAAVGRVFA